MEEESKILEITEKGKATVTPEKPKPDLNKIRKKMILERIAKAMADQDTKDPILEKINLLSSSDRKQDPVAAEEIDKYHGARPAAIMRDGSRIYPRLMVDGRGQINLVTKQGVWTTFKFRFPEDLESLLAEP